MTLCIAGLSESGRKIAVVTDLKAGLGNFSSDWISPKTSVLHKGYTVQYAGEDVEFVPSILRNARAILAHKKGKISPDNVAFALHRAYQQQLRLLIESRVLSRYGYTTESFQKYAKKRCTASVYNILCNKIANVTLSLKFLITGFDDSRRGHIWVAGGEEPPADVTDIGFFAIGSGSPAAFNSLMFNKNYLRMRGDISEARCVYLLCEAKFMAETLNVGAATFVMLLQHPQNGGIRFVTKTDEIKKLWASEGVPRLPASLEEKINPMIVSLEDKSEGRADSNETVYMGKGIKKKRP